MKIILSGMGWWNRGLKYLLKDQVAYIVSRHLNKPIENAPIDANLLFEASGDVLFGVECCLWAFERGIDVVTANIEMDATVGWILAKKAKEFGVRYGFCDGDQPGCIGKLIKEVRQYQVDPLIVGMTKSFLDFHQTPDKVMNFVNIDITPQMACSFADGTKTSYEMVSVANAFDFDILNNYYKIDKIENILDCYKNISNKVINTVMLPKSSGIFVIGTTTKLIVKECLQWLKIPNSNNLYLFYKPYHLGFLDGQNCQIVGISKYERARCVAFAKRNIKSGNLLNKAGSFDIYGQPLNIIDAQKYLPAGFSSYVRSKINIQVDSPIELDDVELEENIATRLWRENVSDNCTSLY